MFPSKKKKKKFQKYSNKLFKWSQIETQQHSNVKVQIFTLSLKHQTGKYTKQRHLNKKTKG